MQNHQTNTFRVLSIDFDYFQNTNEKTLRIAYPDSCESSPEISKLIWSFYYVNNQTKQLLEQVSVNKSELKALTELLNKQPSTTILKANYSHAALYDFVNEHMSNHKKLILTNIDMHSDAYTSCEDNLNCGNWINYLKTDYPDCELRWIANKKISPEDIKNHQYTQFQEINYSIKDIPEQTYDAIFLCRSDAWLPPHLDRYFNDLLNKTITNFPNNYIQKCIMRPRDTKEIIQKLEKDPIMKRENKRSDIKI